MTEPAALALRLDREARRDSSGPARRSGARPGDGADAPAWAAAAVVTRPRRRAGRRRAVVEAAFDQLHAEGWVTTRRGAGTFVDDVGSEPDRDRVRARRPSIPPAATARELVSFDTGTPYVDPPACRRVGGAPGGDVHDRAAARLPGPGRPARAAGPPGRPSRPGPRPALRGGQRARHGGHDPRPVPAPRCDSTVAWHDQGRRDRGPGLPGSGGRDADRRLRRGRCPCRRGRPGRRRLHAVARTTSRRST